VNRMFQLFQLLRGRENGQTLVEYALILALVSITAVAALNALSVDINAVFSDVGDAFTP
jgi:Flp pilus assembly pilin Flp